MPTPLERGPGLFSSPTWTHIDDSRIGRAFGLLHFVTERLEKGGWRPPLSWHSHFQPPMKALSLLRPISLRIVAAHGQMTAWG